MDTAAALDVLLDDLAQRVAALLTPTDLEVMKVRDMAEALHQASTTIRQWCAAGEIPARKVESDWAITKKAFYEHFSGRAAA